MGSSNLLASVNQTHNCPTCQNRTCAEWCVLAQDDLELLNKEKISRSYKTGQLIFSQGDSCTGIFCIEFGNVAIRKADANGESTILRLAHAGQTLGYADFFRNLGYEGSAEALDACAVCHIDSAPLHRLLEHNPSLGLGFLRHVSKDLIAAENFGMQQALYTVRIRMVHLLLTLKDRFARVEDDGTMIISLPMTRQDMAAMLGARPETIYRTIQQLESDQVMKFRGHQVIISNFDVLLDEIGGNGLMA